MVPGEIRLPHFDSKLAVDPWRKLKRQHDGPWRAISRTQCFVRENPVWIPAASSVAELEKAGNVNHPKLFQRCSHNTHNPRDAVAYQLWGLVLKRLNVATWLYRGFCHFSWIWSPNFFNLQQGVLHKGQMDTTKRLSLVASCVWQVTWGSYGGKLSVIKTQPAQSQWGVCIIASSRGLFVCRAVLVCRQTERQTFTFFFSPWHTIVIPKKQLKVL